MTELWFIAIIGLFGLASTILSSKGSLFDKRFKWYKRLTQRGQIVALLSLAIVGLSIWQYVIVKNKDNEKDILQIQQNKLRDSTIAAEIAIGVDSNRRKLFYDLSEALAKQNLILDTVTKNIKSLRDSTKTVILNSPKEDPVILVRSDGIKHLQKHDTVELKISLVSTQASSNLLFLSYLCEVHYLDGSIERSDIGKLLISVLKMPKNEVLGKSFYLFAEKRIDFINIALIGKYTQIENRKEIELLDVYEYSFTTKETSFLLTEKKSLFIEKYKLK